MECESNKAGTTYHTYNFVNQTLQWLIYVSFGMSRACFEVPYSLDCFDIQKQLTLDTIHKFGPLALGTKSKNA